MLESLACTPQARELLRAAEAQALRGGAAALVLRCQAALARFPQEVAPILVRV